MKSEERHELEQNELVNWSTRWADQAWRNRWSILGVIATIGLVFGGWTYYSRSLAARTAASWQEFLAATNPEQFQTLVDRYPGSPAVPYARLRMADLRFQEGKARLANNRGDAILKIDEASKLYSALRDDSSLPPDVREQAAMGAAAAIETKGNIADAIAAYKQVSTDFSGTVAALVAQARIKRLESPDAEKFYLQLAEYKPPATSTDLPAKDNFLDSLNIPEMPPGKTTKKEAKDAKSGGTPTLPEFEREKVAVPTPPKSTSTEKPAAPKSSDKAAKPAEKLAAPKAEKADQPPAKTDAPAGKKAG